VVFTLALVAIIGLTGLVIDAGSTFAQRRGQQNVADTAALAGAYAYLNSGGDPAAAVAAAKAIAAANGYPDGVGGVAVTVTVTPGSPGTTVQVDVGRPHQNYFAGLLGFPSWAVGTTATAITGVPNVAQGGAMPIIFNQQAVGAHGYGPGNTFAYDEPGTGTQDVPQGPNQFNWTVFCTANGNPCNANSNTVDDLINGYGRSADVTLGMLIGPLNAGSHATLFSDLANWVGYDFPVVAVDNQGRMVGFAVFHLTGSVGGSTKQVSGYFKSPINFAGLKIRPGVPGASAAFGAYTVQLVN
jgi:hypothetical protein